jgi:tetratricopeptide (TPR) repeat protein
MFFNLRCQQKPIALLMSVGMSLGASYPGWAGLPNPKPASNAKEKLPSLTLPKDNSSLNKDRNIIRSDDSLSYDCIKPIKPLSVSGTLVPPISVQELQSKVALFPNDEDVRTNLAIKLADEGEIDEANAQIRRAVDLTVKKQEIRKLGDIYYWFAGALEDKVQKKENYAKATDAYREAIVLLKQGKKLNSLDNTWKDSYSLSDVYRSLGIALEYLNKGNEASDAYSRAIDAWPALPEPLMPGLSQLDSYLLSIGNVDAVILLYQKLAQRSPSNTGFTDRIVELQQIKKKTIKYQTAIQANPNNLTLYLRWAEDGGGHQAYREMAERYQAIPISTGNYGNYTARKWAEVLDCHDEPELALIIYQKDIAVNPKNAFSYGAMAKVLQGMNRLEEAISAYRKAVELDNRLYDGSYQVFLDTLLKKRNDTLKKK